MAGVQLGGLGSGLNTLDIIDKLVAVESRPVALYTQRKNAQQVRYDAWTELKTKLNALLTAVNDLKTSATFNSRTVTSSNEAVVTATATSSAAVATYSISVSQLAQAHKVASDRQTSTNTALNTLIAGFNGGTVTINGQSFTINATDTLENVRDNINKVTNTLGVNATIVDNRLVITRNDTGATQITFTDDATDKPLEKLGILTATGTIKNELVAAKDASLTVDGLTVTRSSNTLTDVISGVTLTLKGVGGPATVEVKRDEDKVVNAVKSFVDAYNNVVNDIRSRTGKGGRMQGDTTLVGLEIRLRQMVTSEVSGLTTQYKAVWQVGVSVASGVEAAKSGNLSLDETKLRDALAADPTAVEKLFSASTAAGDAADGVATQLYSYTNEYTKYDGLIDNTQEALQNQINEYDEQIKALKDRLELVRKDLVRRFTAMEEAVSALKVQGQWLAGQVMSLYNG